MPSVSDDLNKYLGVDGPKGAPTNLASGAKDRRKQGSANDRASRGADGRSKPPLPRATGGNGSKLGGVASTAVKSRPAGQSDADKRAAYFEKRFQAKVEETT